MKRAVVLLSWLAVGAAVAQPAPETPIAVAEKQEAEERYKTLTARLENLEESLQTLQQNYQKRLGALADELKGLRDEVGRLGSAPNAATQKSMEILAEAIKEVDRKRMADNEKILSALEDFRKGLLEKPGATAPPSIRTNPPATAPNRPRNEAGYEYTVRSGDNPTVIARALNQQGIKVTAKQIIDANPGVNWTRLKVGQKLFIPAPQ
jgi:LysM repeat protein